MHVIIWVISGFAAGWIAGLVVRGRGYGLIGDLLIGILGGVIGVWVFSLLGMVLIGVIGNIIVAFIGGIILIAIVRILHRRKGGTM